MKPQSKRTAWLAAALLCGVTAAHAAEPEEPLPTQAARRHFDSGVVFFERGDYESARIEFEASFRLTKHPDLLVNLCIVAEKQARFTEAISYCDQYLRTVPDAKDAASVQSRLERLRRLAASPAPPTAPVVQKPAEPPTPPPPAPAPQEPSQPRRRSLAGPLALTVSGGALVITGIALGAAALSISREAEQGPVFSMLDALNRKGQALEASAITFDVLGGAATVAGITWLAIELKRRRP